MNAQADENEIALPADSGFFREGAVPHLNYPNNEDSLAQQSTSFADLHLAERMEFYP